MCLVGVGVVPRYGSSTGQVDRNLGAGLCPPPGPGSLPGGGAPGGGERGGGAPGDGATGIDGDAADPLRHHQVRFSIHVQPIENYQS